jgi:hypothetical protein
MEEETLPERAIERLYYELNEYRKNPIPWGDF